MSTLVTADLHLAENPRDAYRFKFLEETLPALIREHGATRVLLLGDLTEAKDGHHAALVNRIVDGIAAIAELADVIALMGNHDYRNADVPFYRFLHHLPRVRWIGKPTPLTLRGLGSCLFLPHTPDLNEWQDYLADGGIADGSYDWVFCHQTFGDADLGHGHKVGGEPPPFPKGARAVSGDVHVPQKLGPVTYAGSPYSVDFGDDFEPRVLLLDGDKMRSVHVPGPQKVLLEVRWPGIPKLVAPAAVFSTVADVAEGDVVKVRVTLPAEAEVSRAQVRAAARAWAEDAGVQLYATEVIATAPQAEKAAPRQPHRTDEQLVRAYAQKMGKDRVAVAAGLKIAGEIS